MARRTTLTLEDDVVSLLEAEVRRTGRPLKLVVNDALRMGLDPATQRRSRPFVVAPRDLGVRPGIELDDIAGLIERLEGPSFR